VVLQKEELVVDGRGQEQAPAPVDHSRDVFSIANVITVLRMALIPFFFFYLVVEPPASGPNTLAFALFTLSAATDWLDGFIARRTGTVTAIGKIIDPLVDRLLIASALIGLLAVGRVDLWLVALLIGRDVYLLYGTLLLERHGRRVEVSVLGKWTTALLLIGFASLIWNAPLVPLPVVDVPGFTVALGEPQPLGVLFVWAGVVTSIVSAVQYTIVARREYREAIAEEKAKAAAAAEGAGTSSGQEGAS
jgi:cardiolipin synthase